MNEITLKGCKLEPLMSYLKALGVLRIVAEQIDPGIRGCWREGVFVIRSELDEKSLIDFFINIYKPTPVIVPWSGADFFAVDTDSATTNYTKIPTSSRVIEAFLSTTSERLSEYRDALICALSTLQKSKISKKEDLNNKRLKRNYIAMLRSNSHEKVVDWIDTCSVLTDEKATFSALLGSGGGSDGNTHFSDNFMQNLWDVLPDFDQQRKKKSNAGLNLLIGALQENTIADLVPGRTSTIYDAGASGGVNAGQGFERVSLANPWNFILCLEGTLFFAGAIARRYMKSEKGYATFPFQARLSSTNLEISADKERSGKEIWLPVWEKWASYKEICSIFNEGRMSVGGKLAEYGVDFARAAATLGADRGIHAFHRYIIVKGRIGGENYNTSAHLGRFYVSDLPHTTLLQEIDAWLNRLRIHASDDDTPPRFRSALRRIESSIFAYCQYGGARHFADILCALGAAEMEFSRGKDLFPLAGLDPEWISAADDGSVEFEIALSLAGIHDASGKVGLLRSNLEPVRIGKNKQGEQFAKWTESDREVVWSSLSLARNMAAVLERRLMDSGRNMCESLPFAARRTASLDAVSAFLAGETDDERIKELLWGMILIDHSKTYPRLVREQTSSMPLPRVYALLKLLFLPWPLHTDLGDVEVRPEPAITALLRANRLNEACALALRRLRSSGLVPMYSQQKSGAAYMTDWHVHDPTRLAAALLIPVSSRDIETLRNLVLRPINDSMAVSS